jgi:diguanylate cyclase (GGDEF)-like protein
MILMSVSDLGTMAVAELDGSGDDERTLARYAGALFVAGGLLGALTLALPHPSQFNDAALLTNTSTAVFAGLLAFALAGRLPRWSLQVALALGTALVTRAVYYSNEPSAYYSFFYLWIVLYSFYFFGRFWGLVQTAWIGASYAWVLIALHSSTGSSRWLMGIVSLASAGLLIDRLASQLRHREAEANQHAEALAAVGTVARELALRAPSDSAAPVICESAAEVTGAAGASLWEPTADGSGLEAVAATDSGVVGLRVSLAGEPSGTIRAFNTRKTFFVADATAGAEVDSRVVDIYGAASLLFTPILREQTPIGVLALYWKQPIAAVRESIEQVVELLASEAAIAIERSEMLSQLERAARTDDLTGLPNRRAWEEHLGRELARSSRIGAPLCVAMLDLDHFKQYNDQLGHQAGDRFLKEAAASWQACARETDLIARYGGEEFAVALLDCGLERAQELMESLRGQTPEGASCSIGLAQWNGRESGAELVERADCALYEAKRGGRDRVVIG